MSYAVPQSGPSASSIISNVGGAIQAIFAPPATSSGQPVVAASSGPNWMLIGGIGLAAVVAIMVLKKRKK